MVEEEEIEKLEHPEQLSREDLLKILADIIKQTHEKVWRGRIKNPQLDKVRQGWIRVLCHLCSTYGTLLRDQDIEKIEKRLKELEEHVKES